MMVEKGVNWNDLDVKFKRGTYIKKVRTSKPFTSEELENLPKGHNAHRNPGLVIERNIIGEVELPIFTKIKNSVDVIFNDAEPIVG